MKKTWKKWAMAAAAMFGGATMATTAQAEQAPVSDYELSDSAVSNFSPISVTNSKTSLSSYAVADKTAKPGFGLSAQTLEDISQMAKVETASSNAYSAKPIAKSLNISATAPTSDYARLKTTPQEPSSTAHTQTVGPMKIPAYTISHIPDDFKLMGKKMETGSGFKLPAPYTVTQPESTGLKLSGNVAANDASQNSIHDNYRLDRTKIESAGLKLPSPTSAQNIQPLPLKASFENLSGSRLNFPATPSDTLSQYAPMSQKPEKNKWNERLKYTAPPAMGKSISESAQKIQTAPSKCSINFTKGMDAHYKKGQSDQRGDHKAAEITLRCNNTIADLHLGISTPQYIKRSDSRDTSILAASYGRIIPLSEKTELEVTGRVGIVNGLAKTTMGAIVNAMHKMQGMGASRVSEDTGTRPLAGITFRADHTENVAKLSKHKLAATFTQYSVLGTDKIEAGAAATVSLISGGAKPLKPNIQGLPNQINSGSGVYLTGMVSGIAYDLATHSQGTKHVRFTTGVGVQKDFGKVVLGFDATLSRSPEINGGYKPISQIGLHLGVKF